MIANTPTRAAMICTHRRSMTTMPNKSPEPTRVGAVSNPRRFGLFIVFSRGWLSFFRWASASHCGASRCFAFGIWSFHTTSRPPLRCTGSTSLFLQADTIEDHPRSHHARLHRSTHCIQSIHIRHHTRRRLQSHRVIHTRRPTSRRTQPLAARSGQSVTSLVLSYFWCAVRQLIVRPQSV